MAKRKRRSDHGSTQTTERDLYILRWIGDMFAVRVDHLQVLAALLSEDEDVQAKGELSFSGIQYLYRRWEKARWIEREKIFAGQPQWLWLKQSGIRHVGLTYPYWQPGQATRLIHIHHVNAVRLYLEGKHGSDIRWFSERSINQARKKEKKQHLVDGEVLFKGVRAAIEVEIARKTPARLDSILRELKQDYEAVYYFADDNCYSTVETAIQSIEGHKNTFVLYHLSDVMNRV